jgi:hypothetical protein
LIWCPVSAGVTDVRPTKNPAIPRFEPRPHIPPISFLTLQIDLHPVVRRESSAAMSNECVAAAPHRAGILIFCVPEALISCGLTGQTIVLPGCAFLPLAQAAVTKKQLQGH